MKWDVSVKNDISIRYLLQCQTQLDGNQWCYNIMEQTIFCFQTASLTKYGDLSLSIRNDGDRWERSSLIYTPWFVSLYFFMFGWFICWRALRGNSCLCLFHLLLNGIEKVPDRRECNRLTGGGWQRQQQQQNMERTYQWSRKRSLISTVLNWRQLTTTTTETIIINLVI